MAGYGNFGRGPGPGEQPTALDRYHDVGPIGPPVRRPSAVPDDETTTSTVQEEGELAGWLVEAGNNWVAADGGEVGLSSQTKAEESSPVGETEEEKLDRVLTSPIADAIRRAGIADVIPRGTAARHFREYFMANNEEERAEILERHRREYLSFLGEAVDDKS